MGLFRMEIYKILRRRFWWGCLAAVTVIVGAWLAGWVTETDTVIDGVRYTGIEAVRRDREIARQWEGTLTMEKLYAILDTYGMAVNEGTNWETSRTGNWVSRYATDELTDFLYREDHSTAELKGEDDPSVAALRKRLEQYEPYFCYMDQVDFLYEALMSVNVIVLILVILGLAPVFTEEYQQKTASVLLTCVRGRNELMRAKLLASLAFAGGLFVLADGTVFLLFLLIYGTDGMSAGASLVSWFAAGRYAGGAVWQGFLFSFLWGLAGVLVMTVTSLMISAASVQGVRALGGALLFFVSGYCTRALMHIFPFFAMRLLLGIYEEYCPVNLITKAASAGILNAWMNLGLIAAGVLASLSVMRKEWTQYEG